MKPGLLTGLLVALLAAPCGLARATPSARPDAIATAIAGMDFGLTDLREAAGTGDPVALRQAEREVLLPLLLGLDDCVIAGRVDPTRYRRLYAAVTRVQGMFKEIPYRLVVQPGGGLPSFTLELRRSPVPVLRSQPTRWRVEPVDGGVRLLAPLAGGFRKR
ncbi:MAG TPA: hypothetical protein V6D47_11225 [Oscillatoriaceae cyanobacterium]